MEPIVEIRAVDLADEDGIVRSHRLQFRRESGNWQDMPVISLPHKIHKSVFVDSDLTIKEDEGE